ncbi:MULTISPECIES: MarR family winged helix-turn-helix transcriptional regulator [unclassified Methylobacterium]|uniref:MarR family winged helix-turn-helix transcriptional regulator n=1 Tax=unclassified Methylobacterium TaxID=2615210 RepID=UPI00036CB00A|nr:MULTISPECIES: MarR family transcriptional regulator [unclassified Methylobacterium]KQP53369.1 MarR family transcriptional regulator [Methylobacterium sp. Leaf106]
MNESGLAEADAAPSPEALQPLGTHWLLPERPGFLIRRLHQIHVSLFSERCGAFRITPLQYSLLSLLAECGEADQTTLANAVALDRTTTTGAIKRLEARGFVERSASPTDRRSQRCRLTQAGRVLLSRMEAAARQAHDATLESLSEDEQATLIRLMKKITAANQQRRGKDELLG